MSLRKPSSTNPPPDGLVFFTDRDLGNAIPDALVQAGAEVRRHDNLFASTTPDTEWLSYVGAQGWIALSRNKKIEKVRVERDIAMRAGVPLFFLVGKLFHPQLAANLVLTLPRVIRFYKKNPKPFMAKIHRPEAPGLVGIDPGRVEMSLTLEDWRAIISGTK